MNTFKVKEEMDKVVQDHIYYNADKLPESNRKILRVIAGHAFTPIGTAHLKIATIAQEVGCSETTVSRGIKRLVELKIISVEKGKKLNGIQGANFYSILNFSQEMTERVQEREMTKRAVHEKPCESKVKHTKVKTETGISFKQPLSNFVVKNVNTYSACEPQPDLKQRLKEVYKPQSVEGKRAFEELCMIAFGRLKQGLKQGIPYPQISNIVLKAMHDLVRKQNVKNEFAMYSAMIKRQVEQLFQAPVKPTTGYPQNTKENVPTWFKKTYEPSTDVNNAVDYEVERQKILAQLGAC